jgi:plasmid stabilization system protein ParE
MAGKKIVWSKKASIIFDEVLSYYIERNKSDSYSKKLYSKVNKAVANLIKFPFLGKITDNPDCRALVIDDYAIFYKVLDTEILIVLFWDHRQNPDLLSKELS